MPGSRVQVVLVTAGTLVLGVLGLWALAERPPTAVALVALPLGLGLVAWGLIGPGARRARDDVRDALDAGDALLRAMDGSGVMVAEESRRGAQELASLLRRAAGSLASARGGERDRVALREVIEAVGEPVVATDPRGRVVIVNRAAERVLGLRGEAGTRTIEDVLAQADVLALHESASRGRPASARVRLAVPDGARVFDTSASPIARDGAGPGGGGDGASVGTRCGVVLAFRDVTDLTTAIQARTDFVANASHELRTPLAAMKAAYETLRTALDDPAMRERALQLSERNLQRLEDMTRDLLDLSRMESPDAQVRISRVDVQELAEDVAGQFEQVCATRGLTIAVEVAPGARWADTDPRLVQEVLRNLMDNACRFAHEGTTVRVVGEVVAGDAHGPERATLRLRVIDRGIGIPLDQQTRIFERFYQVDPARSGRRRGTGLGLAIVKHAVRALGGSVKVESVWGQGTTMIVDLPSAAAVGESAAG